MTLLLFYIQREREMGEGDEEKIPNMITYIV